MAGAPLWTDDEIDRLIELRERGLSFKRIALRLGRSLASVGNKANRIERAEAARLRRRPPSQPSPASGRGGREGARP